MISDDRHIIGLSVVTRSGRLVGKVKGLQIDIEQHFVKNYVVAQGVLPIIGKELLIDPAQVLEITTQQMVVIDGGELPNAEIAGAMD
jgi:sporulation protein YlmC with PRC-barrel domain